MTSGARDEAICRVTPEALIKTGKMGFNCPVYYRPHETLGTPSSDGGNRININIFLMDAGSDWENKYFGKTEIFATWGLNVLEKASRGGNPDQSAFCITSHLSSHLITFKV